MNDEGRWESGSEEHWLALGCEVEAQAVDTVVLKMNEGGEYSEVDGTRITKRRAKT